jgi:hypothetical protein
LIGLSLFGAGCSFPQSNPPPSSMDSPHIMLPGPASNVPPPDTSVNF